MRQGSVIFYAFSIEWKFSSIHGSSGQRSYEPYYLIILGLFFCSIFFSYEVEFFSTKQYWQLSLAVLDTPVVITNDRYWLYGSGIRENSPAN